MSKNLKKKIDLSNFLEQIEINRDNEIVINKLDEYHSNPKAHVIGITGSPGVGKSSLIDKLIQKIRKKKICWYNCCRSLVKRNRWSSSRR